MKPPSSSSTAASSTSSASPACYHLNSDAAGCLSGILRRLVCGSLDVGSSRSRVADAAGAEGVLGGGAGVKDESMRPHAAPLPVPGLVARLMGLESMPALHCAPQGHIGRSRSTGSVEGWPALLPVPAHRRSHSFRETPTFLRQENDEFLLLSFCDDDGEEEEIFGPRPEGASHEMVRCELDRKDGGREETPRRPSGTERATEKVDKKTKKKGLQREISREKAAERCRRREGHTTAHSGGTGSAKATTGNKGTPERLRATRKGDKKKRSGCSKAMVEPECSSQNSSPVSVLDRLPELDGDSLTDTSTPISDAEEEPRPEVSSRRKLSSESDCFNDPSPFCHLILVEEKEGSTSSEEGRVGTARDVPVPHSSSNLWAEACRLVEMDLQRQPWKIQDSEKIVLEFGLQILEDLLQEIVGELICHVPSAPSHHT